MLKNDDEHLYELISNLAFINIQYNLIADF